MSALNIPLTITLEDQHELVRRALLFAAANELLHEELRQRDCGQQAATWDARQHVAFDGEQEAEQKLKAWAHSLYAKSQPQPPEAAQPTPSNGAQPEVVPF